MGFKQGIENGTLGGAGIGHARKHRRTCVRTASGCGREDDGGIEPWARGDRASATSHATMTGATRGVGTGGAFTAGPPRDPGEVHLGDHGRQGRRQLAGEILDAGAVDHVSLMQVRGQIAVAAFSPARLALGAEHLGTPQADRAALTAAELEQLEPSKLPAHHRRAGRRQFTRTSEGDAGGQTGAHARVALGQRARVRRLPPRSRPDLQRTARTEPDRKPVLIRRPAVATQVRPERAMPLAHR
jgi:hypothetical protein